MTRSATLVVPGALDSRTGGYLYDRHIVDGLRARGWSVEVRELDGSFPRPTDSAYRHAAHVFADIPLGSIVLVDSLAAGSIPAILEEHASRLRLVALMHLPLAAAVGLDRDTALRFAETERRALQAVRTVVVTGKATIPLVTEYGVPPARIAVVEPGTARAPLSQGSGGSPLQLLTVATLNPGKGHEDLLESLAAVRSRDWRLTCAGSLVRDPGAVERVREAVRRLDLEAQVLLVGELDEPALEAQYLHADVFVLATLQETYGMAVAEALARGIPVVSTTTGAIPELVGVDAGVLVAPGDRRALTHALERVIGDGGTRERLAAGARVVRQRLPDWDHATTQMAATLDSLEP